MPVHDVALYRERMHLRRLDTEFRARLERVREALSKRAGGVDLVTSHVVREVIERGLDSIERDMSRR
jgi:predicted DNA-binding protein